MPSRGRRTGSWRSFNLLPRPDRPSGGSAQRLLSTGGAGPWQEAAMISAALLLAAAIPAQTPVSPQQYAYSAWGQCLESQLAPDRYMTAPRITDGAMQACMRFEQD